MPSLPQTLTGLEDAVVGQLQPAVPDRTRVEPFPNDPSTYRLSGDSALLVVLEGEEYKTGEDDGLGLLGVQRRPRFNVIAVAKQRRTRDRRQGQQAAYGLVDTALGALGGAEVAECYFAIPRDLKPLGLNPRDKTWRYQQTYQLISQETLGLTST
jgi:hypothetical protein